MTTTKVIASTSTIEEDDGETRETTQYRVTVPKNLAEALDLGGEHVEWSVESGNSLKITKTE